MSISEKIKRAISITLQVIIWLTVIVIVFKPVVY